MIDVTVSLGEGLSPLHAIIKRKANKSGAILYTLSPRVEAPEDGADGVFYRFGRGVGADLTD